MLLSECLGTCAKPPPTVQAHLLRHERRQSRYRPRGCQLASNSWSDRLPFLAFRRASHMALIHPETHFSLANRVGALRAG